MAAFLSDSMFLIVIAHLAAFVSCLCIESVTLRFPCTKNCHEQVSLMLSDNTSQGCTEL